MKKKMWGVVLLVVGIGVAVWLVKKYKPASTAAGKK